MRSLPGLFAARGSPRLSHHVARDVAEAARAAHIHRVRQLRAQLLHVGDDTLHAAAVVADEKRPADHHRVRAVRDQINTYMRTVMGEEPVDPSLEILPDEESW